MIPRPARIKLLLAGGLASVAIATFAMTFAMLTSEPELEATQKYDLTLKLVREAKYEEADLLFQRIDELESDPEDLKAKRNLAQGVLAWNRAANSSQVDQAHADAQVAVDSLDLAKSAGFPNGYEGLGNYCLGLAQAFLGKFEAAVPALMFARDHYPTGRDEVYASLVHCFRSAKDPSYSDKQESIKSLFDEWETLSVGPSSHDFRRLTLAKDLFRTKKYREAVEQLTPITQESPFRTAAQIEIGKNLLELALESRTHSEAMLEEALSRFRKVAVQPETSAELRRQSQYWMGRCLDQLGRKVEATSLLASLRIGAPQSSEAIAAGVREISIFAGLGDADAIADIVEQLQATRLSQVQCPDSICDAEQFRVELVEAGGKLLAIEAFPQTVRFANSMPEFCLPSDRERLLAKCYEKWAESLAKGNGDDRDETERMDSIRNSSPGGKQVEELWQLAGEAYERLARHELRSAEYPEILWSAIDGFHRAHNDEKANKLLRTYMQFEERVKQPRAYVLMGENQLARGQFEQAIATLDQCLAIYPKHPYAYRARLSNARAFSEMEDFEKARELLEQNLYDGQLSPESELWRESLLYLGETIFRQGTTEYYRATMSPENDLASDQLLERYQTSHEALVNCAEVLEEAVQRFGSAGVPIEDQYRLAICNRLAAKWPELQIDQGLVRVEEKLRALQNQARKHKTDAVESFDRIIQTFQSFANKSSERKTHGDLFRNSLFGKADLLFELGQYKEAVGSYRVISNRFMNEPESLEALVQMAKCYDRLGDALRRDSAYEQAKQSLTRIPDSRDPDFVKLTRASREQWQQDLEWMSNEASGRSTVQ